MCDCINRFFKWSVTASLIAIFRKGISVHSLNKNTQIYILAQFYFLSLPKNIQALPALLYC